MRSAYNCIWPQEINLLERRLRRRLPGGTLTAGKVANHDPLLPPRPRATTDLPQGKPADRAGEVEERVTGALKLAGHAVRPRLRPQAARAGQKMHCFQKSTPVFQKLSTLPQLSSSDLETVSNPRETFFKS